jgi:hypothetical protein
MTSDPFSSKVWRFGFKFCLRVGFGSLLHVFRDQLRDLAKLRVQTPL